MSVGLIFPNNEKLKETDPDISGNVYIDNQKYRFSAWKNEATDGTPITDVRLKEWIEKTENDVPF